MRSGRCYSPETSIEADKAKAKAKAVVVVVQKIFNEEPSPNINEPVTEAQGREFLRYLLQEDNQMTDALATLAVMFKANKWTYMMPIKIQVYESPTHFYLLEEETDGHPWYHDILQYMRYLTYSPGASEIDKKTIRRMTTGYFLDGEILYRRGSDQVLLRCVIAKEVKNVIEEVHGGACGTHTNGLSMARKIMR
ncbi:uncharacterized protein LOC120179131 [Hibiscus syriacus]|uniref:uncharacterized protein LOC120179131 n=1 Tax=Hibiscus syriacus TaxID=106335 RepID=UPI001921680D|nr:uncharacterized protein LOC120179131 [Hibiscus syriacus]